MGRGKKKQPGRLTSSFKYNVSDVESAIEAIREKGMSIRKAERMFGIPKSTLCDKVAGRSPVVCSRGIKPILGMDGEQKLVDFLMEMWDLGHTFQKPEIIQMGTELGHKLGKVKETSSLGKEWYGGIVSRWPKLKELVTQKPLREESGDVSLNFRTTLSKSKMGTTESQNTENGYTEINGKGGNSEQGTDENFEAAQNIRNEEIQDTYSDDVSLCTQSTDVCNGQYESKSSETGVTSVVIESSLLERQENDNHYRNRFSKRISEAKSNSSRNDKNESDVQITAAYNLKPSLSSEPIASEEEKEKRYFRHLFMLMKRYGLFHRPEMVYSLDQILINCSKNVTRVTQGKTWSKNQDKAMMTVLGCGNAIGTTLPPYVIFSGLELSSISLESKLPGSQSTATTNGRLDYFTLKEFLEYHFGRYAQVGLCNNSPVLLFYNGQGSPIDSDIVDWARKQNIIMCLAPSSVAEDFDIHLGCFSLFAKMFNSEVSLYKSGQQKSALTVAELCQILVNVYPPAFSRRNLVQNFKDSGIMPHRDMEEHFGESIKEKPKMPKPKPKPKRKAPKIKPETDTGDREDGTSNDEIITDFLSEKKRQKINSDSAANADAIISTDSGITMVTDSFNWKPDQRVQLPGGDSCMVIQKIQESKDQVMYIVQQ